MVRPELAAALAQVPTRSPLWRMLCYGEIAHWLLDALDALDALDGRPGGGAVRLAHVGPRPSAWGELCQQWRTGAEHAALAAGTLDEPGRHHYACTVMAAYATAFSRLDRPGLKVVELWCGGRLTRLDLGRPALHGPSCACALFVRVLRQLEAVAAGADPFAELATRGLVWLGRRGLCGPHVVEVRGGRPAPLENVLGGPHGAVARFGWGYVGERPMLLARLLLARATGREPSDGLAAAFAWQVVARLGHEFTLDVQAVRNWEHNAPITPARGTGNRRPR